MITLKNNSKTTLIHDNYRFEPNKVIDVPDKIGRIWLMVNGITEYKYPAIAKAEVAKLQAENEKIKKSLNNLFIRLFSYYNLKTYKLWK